MMARLRIPALVALAGMLTFTGWLLMGTNFMIHDDEGYVLIGLRDFSQHGGLYDQVFTQYGPALFLYYDLLHRLFAVKPGDRVLVHAAAGGMGQILSSWARALGAEVIGTVGLPAKRDIALAHGCHHVIDYRQEDFVARVRERAIGWMRP
jgi:NADPH-dependent curcumin reductase CurA